MSDDITIIVPESVKHALRKLRQDCQARAAAMDALSPPRSNRSRGAASGQHTRRLRLVAKQGEQL